MQYGEERRYTQGIKVFQWAMLTKGALRHFQKLSTNLVRGDYDVCALDQNTSLHIVSLSHHDPVVTVGFGNSWRVFTSTAFVLRSKQRAMILSNPLYAPKDMMTY